jgi:hypothetical protein
MQGMCYYFWTENILHLESAIMVLWSPDTCKCVLKLNDSDFSLNQIVKTCPAHTSIDVNTVLAVVFDENHLKNDTMTALKNTVPEITETDREGHVRLKRDEVSFQFEGKAPNRTLRITTKTDISAYEQAIKDEVASQTDAVVDVGVG